MDTHSEEDWYDTFNIAIEPWHPTAKHLCEGDYDGSTPQNVAPITSRTVERSRFWLNYKPKITLGGVEQPCPIFLKNKILKFTFKKHYLHPLPPLSPDIKCTCIVMILIPLLLLLHIILGAVSQQLGAGDWCMAP
jgi:hypothetical protein